MTEIYPGIFIEEAFVKAYIAARRVEVPETEVYVAPEGIVLYTRDVYIAGRLYVDGALKVVDGDIDGPGELDGPGEVHLLP